jgi:hypothetical protein
VTDKAWQEHLIDEAKKIKAYCLAKGWDVYFSKHKELRGD